MKKKYWRICPKCKKRTYHTNWYNKKKLKDRICNKCATYPENNGMYGKSVYDVWIEKYGKKDADRREAEKNKKISKSLRGSKNGFYKKKHTKNVLNYLSNLFLTKGSVHYIELDDIKSDILQLYFNEKKSMRFIGNLIGVSHHVISRRLDEWGFFDKKRKNGKQIKIDRPSGRFTQKYINWRNSILKRDKYICQITNNEDNLVVHHLKSYLKFPLLRYDQNNGITISRHLHERFHCMYGYIDFTEQDFYEFQEKILNGEVFYA